MNNSTPVLSIVMPCFNEEKTVGIAIDSMIKQSFQDFEFIIIDDCSTDSTPEILKQYSKKYPKITIYTNQNNQGYSSSINRGIELAQTSLIARMDADDYSYPDRLEKQYNFLKNNPNIALVGTGVEMVKKDTGEKIGELIMPETHDEIIKNRYSKSFNFHPTIMAKKELFVENNGYDESIKRAEELDLWLRASIKYKFYNLPEVLFRFSVNDNTNIKLKYWYYGFRVRLINMLRRNELFSQGHHLLSFTVKFFLRKYIGVKPSYLKRKS